MTCTTFMHAFLFDAVATLPLQVMMMMMMNNVMKNSLLLIHVEMNTTPGDVFNSSLGDNMSAHSHLML